MATFKLIAFLVLIALVAVFTYQNTAMVSVKFLSWSLSMSTSLMFFAALFAGIIIGWIISFRTFRKGVRKMRDERAGAEDKQKSD